MNIRIIVLIRITNENVLEFNEIYHFTVLMRNCV